MNFHYEFSIDFKNFTSALFVIKWIFFLYILLEISSNLNYRKFYRILCNYNYIHSLYSLSIIIVNYCQLIWIIYKTLSKIAKIHINYFYKSFFFLQLNYLFIYFLLKFIILFIIHYFTRKFKSSKTSLI